MAGYTADAVAVLCYLVDFLPSEADRIFAGAEAGEIVLHVPGTALAEVLDSVSRDKDVRGVTLSGTPAETRRALVEEGPVTVAPTDGADLREYAAMVAEFNIHDALLVASHRSTDTDAIITTDAAIRDAGYETVWE
ncbi:hypothetical protein [Halobellus ruber]|uniref:PIN domain-containing protein n=1 Tax=Halobellus ruber TaxID=2761102 RepID=A0A7J9SEB3_9EURY|nr:hypothetical protein [Halobellus ruber]MBB6644733.1 hypothetical protein [Halobellus ruber]